MKPVKTIILTMVILTCAMTAKSQSAQPDNKIKSIVVTEEKYDMLVKKQYKDSETFYDSRGNISESITYKLGKVDKHFKYFYDSENNKIKEEEYDPSGRIKESSEYKYANGLRTEKTVFDQNKKMKSKKIYTYTTY